MSILEALRQTRVKCDQAQPDMLPRLHSPACKCNGSGAIPDPRAAQAIAVLTNECGNCQGKGSFYDPWSERKESCYPCSKVGRIPNVTEGTLLQAARVLWPECIVTVHGARVEIGSSYKSDVDVWEHAPIHDNNVLAALEAALTKAVLAEGKNNDD